MNCIYTCRITTQPDISPYKTLQRDTGQEHQPYLNYCLELPLAMGVLVTGIPLDHSWRGAIRPAVFVVFMNVCRV